MLLDLKHLLHEQQLTVYGVIHVGAHHGQELPLYCKLGAREIALFEPLKANFDILSVNVDNLRRQSNAPRIDLYPLALGSQHLEKIMTVASNDGQSSSLLQPKEHLNRHPGIQFNQTESVFVTRMDRVLTSPDRYNLLCIDVQGYELEVLRGAGPAILYQIEAVCCEVNRDEVYEGNAMVGEIDEYLSGFGFQRVATVWAGGIWGDALYVRKPTSDSRQPQQLIRGELRPHASIAPNFFEAYSINMELASGRALLPGIAMHDRCELMSFGSPLVPSRGHMPDAIRVVKMGRYSNNVVQLLHAALIAKVLGISRIVLPADFALWRGVDLDVGHLTFVQQGITGADDGLQLSSYFWFPGGSLQSLFRDIPIREAFATAACVVKPLFYQYFPFFMSSGQTTLDQCTFVVAHIRSGDLFRSSASTQSVHRPHPYYVQPPLAFYQLAIEHALSQDFRQKRVQLVIEDHCNPVVSALASWLAEKKISYDIIAGDFQEAIQIMLTASAVISAYGSVIEMIGMLSDTLEAVYVFRGYGRWAEKNISGHANYQCLGSSRYIHELFLQGHYIDPGSWLNTKEQQELMLSYRASSSAWKSYFADASATGDQPFFLCA